MTVSTVNGIEIKLDVSKNEYFVEDYTGETVKYWKTINGATKWIEKHWAD